MLKTVKFRLLFAFGLLGYLYFSVNVLLTTPIENKDTVPEQLHFKDISAHKFKGSLSYNLYVLENDTPYKIGADWANCFYYNDFVKRVKPGQLIKIGFKKRNGFLAPELKLVVTLMADNHSYLEIDCANTASEEDRKFIPIFGFAGLIVVYFLFLFQEEKTQEKIRKRKPKIKYINKIQL